MSQVEVEGSLEETVDRLAEKARRTRQAQNLESRVNRATDNIQQLTRELYQLEKAITTLEFYVGVATQVFDIKRPQVVSQALESVKSEADISDEQLLNAADAGEVRDLTSDIRDCVDTINDAKSDVIEDAIREKQREWDEEIAAARDLNQLIGGGTSSFEDILDDMDSFLSDSIWDESKSPPTLATRWNRITDQWEENAGRHGWEEFQGEHGLEDDTVEALQRFADKGSLRLDELSISVLEDLKSVEELDSAIRLEIDTR